ncbi:hypothetical protein GUITHDRAFT_135378 [Guillardia theta CCMP2712]|uniref:Uncharacterized protein n=1 Tax=Guillardia theta (strain CCMP2712) TaxID=905079 RepID=L1JP19_GUITC|nr:hypothetical protein GUITHDRAFT_135378 [Guillardia theta CCMP2712]EKX50207.1 hypothetical protein GUITHDRAFT_135378 [Guillardia theta CCMP2712]|mmetsp:Transcript_2979/g.10046  ORF Transcript_2979/g.10046 Transcript_2979/m.10046 type:complete len:141 (-) Transcript_2979:2669-3091(-)|eukprot:XP_005837187.1 hypothetical protein GUITHDRAFT_135378 [Guillardia theta CCMP2712]
MNFRVLPALCLFLTIVSLAYGFIQPVNLGDHRPLTHTSWCSNRLSALRSSQAAITPQVNAKISSVQLRAKPDEDDDELLEECMLVMKPCDPKVTTDDDECIDEKALETCQAASEAAVRAKLANLAAKDDKEDRDLAEGSY